MSEEILLALIVAVPTVIASTLVPTVILWMNNRHARRVKEEDASIRKQEKLDEYKRADEIEARRKQEADEVARLLKTNTAITVETAGDLKGQVQQVHALVNSNLTKEMKARLVEMQTGLTSQIEIADLREALGRPKSETATAHMGVMRKAIEELKDDLETRKEVTEAAASEKKVTEVATKAAVAAIKNEGPLAVVIQQEEGNPVPVKQADVTSGEAGKG